MDMSPMIDMVFLLLIFFMVASRMVTVRVDPDHRAPGRGQGDQAVKNIKGRIHHQRPYPDGTFTERRRLHRPSPRRRSPRRSVNNFREIPGAAREREDDPPCSCGHTGRRAVRDVKKATKPPPRAGGVNRVVFGSFQTDKEFK